MILYQKRVKAMWAPFLIRSYWMKAKIKYICIMKCTVHGFVIGMMFLLLLFLERFDSQKSFFAWTKTNASSSCCWFDSWDVLLAARFYLFIQCDFFSRYIFHIFHRCLLSRGIHLKKKMSCWERCIVDEDAEGASKAPHQDSWSEEGILNTLLLKETVCRSLLLQESKSTDDHFEFEE